VVDTATDMRVAVVDTATDTRVAVVDSLHTCCGGRHSD
jgi:hypothetical protein